MNFVLYWVHQKTRGGDVSAALNVATNSATKTGNPANLSITGLTADERLAALADSALSEADARTVLDELLRSSELCASWHSLHRSGDYLRSEDLVPCDADSTFWQNFSARLDQEPTLLAPKSANFSSRRIWIRYGLPGAAVAAAVMVSWMTLPQLSGTAGNTETVALRNTPATPATVNSAPEKASFPPSLVALGSAQSSSAATGVEAVSAKPVDARQLRNYLAAHQQFSASALRGPVAIQSASFDIIRAEE